MSYPIKSVLISLAIFLGLSMGLIAISQEAQPTDGDVIEAINLDEDVQPEDLEIKEPKLLPDNPFYSLKEWGRNIRSFFTFNKVKKAELKAKFANEKLMEVKKMIEKKKSTFFIKRGLENYQEEIEEVKEVAEKIKETAAESPEVDKFLTKLTNHQILHQKLLTKLETQVAPEAFEKIKEARESHLERFAEVMTKLEDRKEKITEKLDKVLEEQKGSQFKNFKNLEVLMELEEKVPEVAKEAIQRAQENALKRLRGDLEKMSPEDQERFKEYIEKISGEKEKQLEILENLKSEIKALPETPEILKLEEKLEEGKIRILEKIEEKLEELDCPAWVPEPVFCEKGRLVIEKDPETGCPLRPRCVVPGEVEKPQPGKSDVVCITLWDPVCGVDGKTYSNACFAKASGAEVNYEGVCKE